MNELALTIKDRLNTLRREYDRRLREIRDYAQLPARVRLDAAQSVLEVIAQCLEVGDAAPFIRYVHTRMDAQPDQDLGVESLLQALTALEETLLPLVTDAEAAKFLWRAWSEARNTVSRKANEMLCESEQKFRSLADNVAVGIFIHQDGLLQYMGREATRVLGYDSPDELVGRSILDFVWAEERERVADIARRRVLGEPVPDKYETRLVRQDGTVVDVLMYSMLIEYEGRTATQGTFIDLTERKQAEEELLRLRRAVERTADGIAVADVEGNIQFVNPAWARMHGYAPEELLGKHLGMFHTEKQLQEDVFPFNQRVMEAGVHQGEVGHVKKDGTTFPTLMTTALLTDEQGQPTGFVGTASDITERRRLEHQVQESLERRSRQVQISTEVAQEIAAAPALTELFQRVVTLVKERFDYYHTQIFRYEPSLDAVVVVQGYGETGRHMLAEGHCLEMGQGVVGTAAATGQPVLAADVTQDADWVPNPHLPETKGELAVPIKWRGQVLGILDVQSDIAGALTEDDQILLEGLCGQIAIAVESTRLLEEAKVFRQLVEASGQGFSMADLQSNIIYANPTLCRILGLAEPEDLQGQSMLTFYPEEHRQRLLDEIQPIVMQEGQWVGELALLSSDGKVTPTIQNFFLIRDEKDKPRYLANVMTDITEQKRAEAEMAERLYELDALYRSVSREGWEAFRGTAKLPAGYLFDRIAIEPADDLWLPEMARAVEQKVLVPPFLGTESRGKTSGQAAAVAPLSARGEVIGALGVYDTPDRSVSPEDLALLEAVSEQVGMALESARLFEQTRAALSRVEVLYTGSDLVVRATSIDEVLQALVKSTALQQFDRASLAIFDHPWGKEPPSGMNITAVWERSGGEPLAPVGTYYPINQFPIAVLLGQTKPTVIGDLAVDERIDENTRSLFVNRLGMRSAVVLPLVIGGQSIGGIIAQSSMPVYVTEVELRQITTLTDQAATVVQNQRLFEQSQAALNQVQTVHQQYIRRSWQDYLDERARFASPAYVYDQIRVTSLLDLYLPEMIQAVQQKELVLDGGGAQHKLTLALPISLRGQPIGALAIESPPDGRSWTDEEIALVESVAAQLALAIENARLLEQTQVRAHRERLIREITDKIRQKTDLDTILQTTVMELGKALGTSQAAIRLGTDAESAPLKTELRSGKS